MRNRVAKLRDEKVRFILFAARGRNSRVSLLAVLAVRHHVIRKECASGNELECLHSKRKVLSPDCRESEDAKSFEITDKSVYGPSLNYGNKHRNGGAGRAGRGALAPHFKLSQNKYS